MAEAEVVVDSPLVIVYQTEGGMITRLYPPNDYTHQHYGMLVADIVRHVAAAYRVPEDDVWEWVDKERYRPTTRISQPS